MSIVSILGALDRARSGTSLDESGDIDSNYIDSNYDIDCGQGGDELVEGQASRSINRVEVRGKNYTKNCRNRRRRKSKKGLEEGFECVGKILGKNRWGPWPTRGPCVTERVHHLFTGHLVSNVRFYTYPCT